MKMSMRTFETGATRNDDGDALEYARFLSPLALKRYAEYMHKNRVQADGEIRDPDNWKKGMTTRSFMDSDFRHLMDLWLIHDGYAGEARGDAEEALCGILFNTIGYLHEVLKDKQPAAQQEQK